MWVLLTGGVSLLIYVLSRFRTLRGLEIGRIGSDPHVVAEVIRYFVKHPEHRESLNDPSAALAFVTESL